MKQISGWFHKLFPKPWEERVQRFSSREHGFHPDGYKCPCCHTFYPKKMWHLVTGHAGDIRVVGSNTPEQCIVCYRIICVVEYNVQMIQD